MRKHVKRACEIFRSLEEEYSDLPWIINFSGGKDSTVVLHLALQYILEKGSNVKLHVIYNETYLDIPIIRNYVYKVFRKLKRFCKENSLNVELHIIEPPVGKDFFTLVIDRGWPLPRVYKHAPWCVKELKMRPTAKYLLSRGMKNVIYITGLRFEESIKRRKSMENIGFNKPISLVEKEYLGKTIAVSPIFSWSSKDVFQFLRRNKPPYMKSYRELIRLYSLYGSNDKLRTGCWTCTLINKDTMLNNLAKYNPEFGIVLDVKEEMRRISENPKYREKVSKNGFPKGKLTLEGRRQIISSLCKLLRSKVGVEILKPYIEKRFLRNQLGKWLASCVHEKTCFNCYVDLFAF